jgi:HJR/Mrr/RecB family endonuclease
LAFIADLFRAMGHGATTLGGAGDQGVDLIVDYQGERVTVQCKNCKRAFWHHPDDPP